MTRLFPSPLALSLAFALALSAAGGIALFMSEAHAAAAAQPTKIVHCFIGAKHDSDTGWICVPEQRDSDTQ